jgi:excisionase family DNA binding protein
MEQKSYFIIEKSKLKKVITEAVQKAMQDNRQGSNIVFSNENDILSSKEAAKFLNIKVETLYEKTSTKSIPHFKRGNRLYFSLTDLKDWIKSNKVLTVDELRNQAITYTMNSRPKTFWID